MEKNPYISLAECLLPEEMVEYFEVVRIEKTKETLDVTLEEHPFNYLNNSYHRDADMVNMVDCATTFLLSPGIAQVFYGDETGRELSDARFNVDSDQAFRSDMNWENPDTLLLNHFRRLGIIRKNHPSIGRGRQITLDNHTCVRIIEGDTVLLKVLPVDNLPIDVSRFFSDGDSLVELYSGQEATVTDKSIRFPNYRNRITVIAKKPLVDEN